MAQDKPKEIMTPEVSLQSILAANKDTGGKYNLPDNLGSGAEVNIAEFLRATMGILSEHDQKGRLAKIPLVQKIVEESVNTALMLESKHQQTKALQQNYTFISLKSESYQKHSGEVFRDVTLSPFAPKYSQKLFEGDGKTSEEARVLAEQVCWLTLFFMASALMGRKDVSVHFFPISMSQAEKWEGVEQVSADASEMMRIMEYLTPEIKKGHGDAAAAEVSLLTLFKQMQAHLCGKDLGSYLIKKLLRQRRPSIDYLYCVYVRYEPRVIYDVMKELFPDSMKKYRRGRVL